VSSQNYLHNRFLSETRARAVLAARIEIAAHHRRRPNVTEAQQMSQLGQSRRSEQRLARSGPPR
jgi:hypothetical protein